MNEVRLKHLIRQLYDDNTNVQLTALSIIKKTLASENLRIEDLLGPPKKIEYKRDLSREIELAHKLSEQQGLMDRIHNACRILEKQSQLKDDTIRDLKADRDKWNKRAYYLLALCIVYAAEYLLRGFIWT